jgi:hypothetical protein
MSLWNFKQTKMILFTVGVIWVGETSAVLSRTVRIYFFYLNTTINCFPKNKSTHKLEFVRFVIENSITLWVIRSLVFTLFMKNSIKAILISHIRIWNINTRHVHRAVKLFMRYLCLCCFMQILNWLARGAIPPPRRCARWWESGRCAGTANYSDIWWQIFTCI